MQNRVWIIGIVVLLLVVGLSGCVEEISVKISVTTTFITHNKLAAFQVEVKGKTGNYNLTLSDPDKNTIDNNTINENDMKDGNETVILYMVESQQIPGAGSYTVTITNMVGDVVYTKTLNFSGAEVVVKNYGEIQWKYEEDVDKYNPESVNATLKNTGDLPLYIVNLEITVNDTAIDFYPTNITEVTADEGKIIIVPNWAMVLPGETKTFNMSEISSLDDELKVVYHLFDSGTYTATYKLIVMTSAGLGVWDSTTRTITIP